MKDRQMPLDGGEPRIPFVSAALHCVAMTALVFLRSSFGFVYLRPKSVFFAFSWAFVLFAIFAWNEPEVWLVYRSVCLFGAATLSLYWLHLLTAFIGQLREKGRHDRYSGSSNALWLLRLAGSGSSERAERWLHLWMEPALVLVAAATLRLGFDERPLATWLVWVAGCLWCKEALNRWFDLRHHKRQQDIFEDAGETVAPPSTSESGNHEPPKATRKSRVPRPRTAASKRSDAD